MTLLMKDQHSKRKDYLDVLDEVNRMKRCVNCNNIVSDDAQYCVKCGYPIFTFGTLKQLLGNFVGHAAYIQSESYFDSSFKFPLISKLKSEEMNLASIVINDLFEWLIYLRTSDGRILNEEVEFINLFFEKPYVRQSVVNGQMRYEEVKFTGFILDLPYTKEKIDNLIKTKLNENYSKELPMSFKMFYEFDKFALKNIPNTSYEWAKGLLDMYDWLGRYYNALDGDLYGPKRDLFNSYMNNLSKNLNDL